MLRCRPQIPVLNFSFLPTAEKYITVFNDSSMPSLKYDYFEDVILEIKPILDRMGITVYSICLTDQKPLLWTVPIVNPNISQINFLLKNSLLHISTEAYTNEISGILGTPCINLVGNRFRENFYPFWGSKYESIQGLATKKPSFSSFEEKKSINTIYPEVVAAKILEFLNVEYKSPTETVFIGSDYPNIEIDYIPTEPLRSETVARFPINVRLDKKFNLDALVGSAIASPVTLVTTAQIPKQFLLGSKSAIKTIRFFVDEKSDPRIAGDAIGMGIDCQFFLKIGASPKMTRFRFLDHVVREEKKVFRPEVDFSNLFCRNSKIILYNNTKYASYEHLKRNLPLQEENAAFDTPLFMETISHSKLYKRN
jgi:hypothetical protein